MVGYIINRILQIIPTVFGVLLLAFLMIHLVPGDPIEVILGEQALPADREALEEALGLNLPIAEQLSRYATRLAHFDLGTSLYSGRPVVDLIAERLPATLQLAAAAMFVALLIAFPLGIWAACRKGKWPDHMALGSSLVAFSMPNFWLGPLLIVMFSLWLGWLPVSGNEQASSLILPALTLGSGMAAMTTRLLRSSLLEVLNADFIRTARAKGVGGKKVLLRHALRNALLPVMTVIFLQVGALLTGAILTEAVFAWPGLGGLVIDALNQRDYMVVQGCVLFIALVYTLMTLLSDLAYAFVDPRVRLAGKGGR